MSTWVNGRLGMPIDPGDRGLQYGDGLFETMRIRRGLVRLLDYHMDRLYEGCGRLAIVPPKAAALRRELESIAAHQRDAVLKAIITRGVGPRGYRVSGRERCTRIVSVHPLARRSVAATRRPVRLHMCRVALGSNPALAGLKTLNRLESVLARAEWTDPQVWEGLLRDVDGHIVCGTMSNVFVKFGPTLITPVLDRCGVAGVMRRWVIEQAGELRLGFAEQKIRWDDLRQAQEVFMTNAVLGVVPVASIEQGRQRIRPRRYDTAMSLRARLERL